MAEKPKLKETGEILDSLVQSSGSGQRSTTRTPAAAEPPPPPEEEQPLIASALDDTPPVDRRSSRARKRRDTSNDEEPVIDRNPLDFSKYQLPNSSADQEDAQQDTSQREAPRRSSSRRRTAAKNPDLELPDTPETEELPYPFDRFKPPSPEEIAADPEPPKRRSSRRAGTEPKAPESDPPKRTRSRKPAPAAQEPASEPNIQPYAFEELAPEPEAEPPKRTRGRKPAPAVQEPVAEPDIQPYAFEELAPEPEAEPPKRTRSRKPAPATQEPVTEPDIQSAFQEPAPEEELPKRTRSKKPAPAVEEPEAAPEETEKDAFLKALSARFDQAFSERFQDGTHTAPSEKQPARKDKPIPEKRPVFQEEPSSASPAWDDVTDPEDSMDLFSEMTATDIAEKQEDEVIAEETESFLQDFEQKVRQEEEVRAENFKDTLAEKFLRERERYLKELGIAEEPDEEDEGDGFFGGYQPPEPSERPHRRLDLHIQPEMHMQQGDDTPAPLTYGPGGTIRQQAPRDDDSLPYIPRSQQVPHTTKRTEADARKSGEELLLELAAQNSLRGSETLDQASFATRTSHASSHANLHDLWDNRGQTPAAVSAEKQKPKTKKSKPKNIKVIAASTMAGLLVFAVLGWQVLGLFGLRSSNSGDDPALEGEFLADLDTLVLHADRNPEFGERYQNVMIKRSGVSVSNLEIADKLIITDIEAPGTVRLSNLEVGGSIFLQNCAVDHLTLNNVTAERLVISNPSTRVTLEVSGDSSIGTVEFKSASDFITRDLDDAAFGIQQVLVRNTEEWQALDVSLSGTQLHSLSTFGDCQVRMSDTSAVQTVTAQGNLLLEGDGSVLNLSASADAGEDEVSLSLRDVDVAYFNVKSPAAILMNGPVDMMSTSSSLSMTGNGTVGTLMLNPAEGRRLSADISDVAVNALIADSQSTVRAAGNSRIGALTANESVYTLGNRVGHLIVNSNDVIFEEEPDKITVRDGIRPPESVADNPNLDYSLTTGENALSTDTTDDDLATTCNHSRESGGFVLGDGSARSPFEISTPAQLAHINAHLDSHYRQTANIDLADDSALGANFSPIGRDKPFTGSYNGGGYAISGLRIQSDSNSIGLFAESTGVIRNTHITSGEVRATSSQRAYAGGLVGLNFEGGLVESCSNGARVTGNESGYAGGIVGYNYGAKVRDCYNYAKISGEQSVGGIVGANRDSASVVGSYNVGTIDASVDSGSVVGLNSGGSIANCYYLAETSAFGIGDGSGTVIEKTSDEMSDPQMAVDLAAGNEDTRWVMPTSGNYPYPVLGAPDTSTPQSRSQQPGDLFAPPDPDMPIEQPGDFDD